MKNFYLLVLLIFIFSCGKTSTPEPSVNNCIKTNCADYTSQLTAQSDFNSDPTCHDDLDADNDGIACEEPGNTVLVPPSCPTTSSCGCSGKNKAPCQSDPCCKWVVGDGCGCK